MGKTFHGWALVFRVLNAIAIGVGASSKLSNTLYIWALVILVGNAIAIGVGTAGKFGNSGQVWAKVNFVQHAILIPVLVSAKREYKADGVRCKLLVVAVGATVALIVVGKVVEQLVLQCYILVEVNL